ncbi:MAG: hypothetical protein EP339_00130 [Gammaproteobacteria bacterium]|nr:MAG: hypothetical protein EP339_00130 [Gammaproteobacteria bacterium]
MIKSDREHVIRLHLDEVSQLFNTLDPSPFVGRDLDVDAEIFITEWAEELPSSGRFRLEVLVSRCDDVAAARDRVHRSVRAYFGGRVQVARRDLSRLLGEGRISLLIGSVFLAACLTASRLLDRYAGDNGFVVLLSESLLIGGWVAMWRPLEIFLYEWWPLARRIRLLRRLAEIEVHLGHSG